MTQDNRDARCEVVRESISRGRPLDDVAREHLHSCPACARVSRVRTASLASAPALDFDGMFREVTKATDAPRGVMARLQERSQGERVGVALLVMGLVVVAVSLLIGRADLAHYPVVRLAAEMGALTLIAALAMWWGLLPLHRPEPSMRLVGLLVGLALLIPAGLALLPAAHTTHPASMIDAGAALLPRAAGCLMFGLLTAIPTGLGLYAMQRTDGRDRRRAALLAVAAGTAGLLALVVHCPVTMGAHLVVGHAPVTLGAVGLGLLVTALRTTRGRDA